MNNESEYHVNTPTALSGIRGTTYSVDILENNDTCFKTWSGEINVWNPLAKQQASRMKTPGEKTLSPPVEVSGPRIVEGPHEVSMTEWKNIVVKQYETLTVRKNGEADKQQFNPGIEKNDQWVEWNTQRDEDLEKTIPFL